MKKLIFAVIALAVAFTVHSLAPTVAQAQSYDDDDRPRRRYYNDGQYIYRPNYQQRRRYYKPQGDGCGVLIRATGRGFLTRWASERAAINAWNRETFSVYKRNYSWDRAVGKSITCDPYLATQRCTASARPCT